MKNTNKDNVYIQKGWNTMPRTKPPQYNKSTDIDSSKIDNDITSSFLNTDCTVEGNNFDD